MQLLHRYRLHWGDIAMFIGTALLLFGFAIWGLINPEYFEGEDRVAPYVMLGVGVLSIGLLVVFLPRWVGVNRDFILIRTNLRTIRIPLREIASVKPCSPRMVRGRDDDDEVVTLSTAGTKTIGMRFGGIQMSVGKYHNRQLGTFEMITTSRSNMVLITTRSGRKIVINCPVERLTKYLKNTN